MSTFRAFLVALAVLAVSWAPARADIIISVTPSLGPNTQDPLPSATAYNANALSGIPTSSAAGTPGTPGFYAPLSGPTPISSMVVTDFNSWMGNANPTGAYSGEFGTRLFYGLSVTSSPGTDTGLTITQLLNGLSFVGTTSPNTPALDFSFNVPDFAALPASKYSYTTDGAGLVTSFYYVGANNAFAVFAGDDPNDPTNNQAAIDYDLAGIPSFSATGTYSLSGVSGSGTVAITSTPEPASLTLMGIGLGALVWRQRKRLLKKA